MKKIIVSVVVLACVAAVSIAAVNSANIVGYAKLDAIGGQLTLVALNFDPGTNGVTLQDLIGLQVPDTSAIFVWDRDAGSYLPVSNKGRDLWNPNHTVYAGDAFWIKAGGTGTNEVILSGEVIISDTNTVALSSGIDATGFFFPVDISWTNTDLSALLPNLSTLFVWNGNGYDQWNKGRDLWSPVPPATGIPTLGPTSGFWIKTPSAGTWNESRPFDLN
ncbi:MAG: hypothetical protein K9M45_12020 [Kiritimatiellales bacterium]|nr:hypothetical protein [Kiritimatiellales bacterium]